MKKYWKYIILVIGLAAGCIFTNTRLYAQNDRQQQEIAREVLRLHVRADSDSSADQALKLKVKDRIIEELAAYSGEMKDVASSKDLIEKHMDTLLESIQEVLSENHSKDTANIYIGKEWFPQKAYGDVVLPEGSYEAVVVNIGSGEGKNWWCVLFPQLCFIDPACGYVPETSKDVLKDHLSEDTYDSMIDEEVHARFKLAEIFSGIF